MNGVNIKIIEDDSITEKIKRTAKKLNKKYSKTRIINEKIIKKQPLWRRITSGILSVLSTILFVLAILLGFSVVASKMQKTDPCFAGCSVLQVATGSMVASGLEVKSKIVARSIDTDTLNVDDIIVFYDYYPRYKGYDIDDYTLIDSSVTHKHKSGLTFKKFFGLQTEEIKKASVYNQTKNYHPIVHHIRDVYEDANGDRWFKTYGSSNGSDDDWLIHEDYVLGLYTKNGFTNALIGVINFLSNPVNLVIAIMAPFMLIAYFIVVACIKEVYYAWLELDVVEEKRKLTDPICVDCELGFRMDNETKYKVLAQADDNEKIIYIKLLWKDGEQKDSIVKYYHRKRIKLRPMEQLCKLNRECQEMFKNNVPQNDIAKYYRAGRAQITANAKEYKRRLKAISKKYSNSKQRSNADLNV